MQNRIWIYVSCLMLMGEALVPATAESADWPQWRGPDRTGLIGGETWPAELGEAKLERLWRVDLGPSYSGPIVSATTVFTTETEKKTAEVVRAFDRQSGKQLWEQRWAGAMTVPFFARANGSWIRSTPAFDGERLYVCGIRDVLHCLDARSGEILWKIDFVEAYASDLPSFGMVCSPLLDGDAVYLQAGGAACRIDKRTGEVMWRSMPDSGGMMGSSFSSPVIATIAGRRQLVVQARDDLAGLELESGEVLWRIGVPAFRGMNILTPSVIGDQIFTSSYRNKAFLYTVTSDSDGFSVKETWNSPAVGYMSSPVLIDGHAYLLLQGGALTCVDLETGQQTWTSGTWGKYCSLIAQGNRILGLSDSGVLRLVKADPKAYAELGQVRMAKGNTWAHLAISGDTLFVRELKALAAFRWTQP